MLNINEFKSTVYKHDLQRPNLFLVQFGRPEIFVTDPLYFDLYCLTGNGRLVQHFCKNVSVPSFSLNMSDNKRFGIGPNVRMPVGGTYGDVSMTFMSDSELILRNFYNAWMGAIYRMSNDKLVPGEADFHQLRYKKSYQTDIAITLLKGKKEQYSSPSILGIGAKDLAQGAISVISSATQTPFIGSLFSSAFIQESNLEQSGSIVLIDAFPTSMSEISLSSEASSQISEFTVAFTYRDWYFKGPDPEKNNTEEVSSPPWWKKIFK
jgi:hypothetical protein